VNERGDTQAEAKLLMHELSIATSMIEMAGEEAARHPDTRVVALHLKLGSLSGVVKDALLFSYEIASSGTSLEGSRLVIEEVPLTVYCATCDAEKVVDSIQRMCCPQCGGLTPTIVRGRELEVTALELESIDVQPAAVLETDIFATELTQ